MSYQTQSVLIIIGVVAGSIVVFLLFREFWCWYWKINERRDLLRQILTRLQNPQDGQAAGSGNDSNISQTIASADDIAICRKCGSFKSTTGYCPQCRSGFAGKKVDVNTWSALTDLAKEEGQSVEKIVSVYVSCRKCGSLKLRDTVCPKCGQPS